MKLEELKCGQVIRFSYPSSQDGMPKVREGRVDKISEQNRTVTLEIQGEGYKAFSEHRIQGNIEVIA